MREAHVHQLEYLGVELQQLHAIDLQLLEDLGQNQVIVLLQLTLPQDLLQEARLGKVLHDEEGHQLDAVRVEEGGPCVLEVVVVDEELDFDLYVPQAEVVHLLDEVFDVDHEFEPLVDVGRCSIINVGKGILGRLYFAKMLVEALFCLLANILFFVPQ